MEKPLTKLENNHFIESIISVYRKSYEENFLRIKKITTDQAQIFRLAVTDLSTQLADRLPKDPEGETALNFIMQEVPWCEKEKPSNKYEKNMLIKKLVAGTINLETGEIVEESTFRISSLLVMGEGYVTFNSKYSFLNNLKGVLNKAWYPVAEMDFKILDQSQIFFSFKFLKA